MSNERHEKESAGRPRDCIHRCPHSRRQSGRAGYGALRKGMAGLLCPLHHPIHNRFNLGICISS